MIVYNSEPGLNFDVGLPAPPPATKCKPQIRFPGNASRLRPTFPAQLLFSRYDQNPVLPETVAPRAGRLHFRARGFRACAVGSGASLRPAAEENGAFSGSSLCFLDVEISLFSLLLRGSSAHPSCAEVSANVGIGL